MDGPWLGDDASHISVVMSPFSQLISQISLFFVHILFCLRLAAHCVLKWGFTRTFPGNQDLTVPVFWQPVQKHHQLCHTKHRIAQFFHQ